VDRHAVIPLAGMIMIVVLALGVPLVRALIKRWEREDAGPRVPSDLSHRLERIEQAVDAMSIEVERISEGQRFTTKLLSARADGSAPAAEGVARQDRLAGGGR
jgi:hypothetical protein